MTQIHLPMVYTSPGAVVAIKIWGPSKGYESYIGLFEKL